MPTVFYSWQSDRPTRVNRSLIRDALEVAIGELNADVSDADRPDDRLEIDHDTRGLPGSPDITASILSKIELADVFVADVTPIALTETEDGRPPRQVANPNVLIELGYAKKALGPHRIIQIWNTAFTACRPEDLPFDMRGRRGPISYDLPSDSAKEVRQSALPGVAKALKAAIAAILETYPGRAVVEAWHPADEKDPSIWPTDGGSMMVNEPDHGSGSKRVFPPPRAYARILPNRWQNTGYGPHDVLLGPMSGFSWGDTRGGVVTYPGTITLPHLEKIDAVTKRFDGTGEIWATKTGISGMHDEVRYFYGDEIAQYWAEFLNYELKQMTDGGAESPFKVRLGVVGLGGLHWSVDSRLGRAPIALEDSIERSFTLPNGSSEEIFQAVLDVWIDLRKVFSVPEPSMPQKQALMARLRI